MTAIKKEVTAYDINLAIKKKYSGEEWRVWFEVSEGTGYNSGRRADAVVMNIWPSKDYQLHVFEVKVSRADFKSEMANLKKSQAIGKYSDFFWLACPAGLVDKREVPSNWGLMELTKAGLRIKKQAPAKEAPEALNRRFVASLLRSGESLTEGQISKLADERAASLASEQKKYLEKQYNRNLILQKTKIEELEEWKAEFEKQFGPIHLRSNPKYMIERMRIAADLQQGKIVSLAQNMENFSKVLRDFTNPETDENDKGCVKQ